MDILYHRIQEESYRANKMAIEVNRDLPDRIPGYRKIG